MYVQEFRKIALPTFVFIYLILELWHISLPALYDEESSNVIGAIAMIKGIGPFVNSKRIFNTYFPLTTPLSYHGAVECYLLLPFFLLFGVNIIVLRLVEIALGVSIITFTYLFLKDFFDIKVAILTIFFLIINSTFLLHTKLGTNSATLLNFCATGAILCFWKWYKGRKEVALYIGLFLLGLGLTTRAWFIWFINAMIVLAIIFNRELMERVKGKALKYIMIGFIFFLAGAFLIFYYNFSTKFETIKYIFKHFFQTRCSINNLNYFSNLQHRIIGLEKLLNGSGFFEENPGNYGAKIFQHPFSFNNTYILIFIFSILSLCIYLISKENFVSRKRVAFILLLFILIFMQTPFTLSGFCVTHLFILYPIIQIILGLAVAIIFGLFSKDVIISLIVSSFFLGFFLSEVDSVIKNIYLHFKKTGGSGNISESIYSVNEYMKSKNLTKVVAMDWALKHNIIFLSKGGNIPIEFCYIEGLQKSHQEREKFVREIKSLFGEGEPYIYLFRAPEFMNHEESYDIFKKEVNDSGKILKTEKIFYQRDGRPSFYIYSVK